MFYLKCECLVKYREFEITLFYILKYNEWIIFQLGLLNYVERKSYFFYYDATYVIIYCIREFLCVEVFLILLVPLPTRLSFCALGEFYNDAVKLFLNKNPLYPLALSVKQRNSSGVGLFYKIVFPSD